MGKGYYIGGSTKIGIYNKNENMIKKIYKELHSEVWHYNIPFQSVKEFFKGYYLDELEEIYEDISTNYQGRRVKYLLEIKRFNMEKNNK